MCGGNRCHHLYLRCVGQCVLTKQTANLKQEGKSINYEYDYGRLTAINYPDHPENNVKYYYGGIHSSYNRIGRLMLREDGSGAIEYYYGKMGEVTKTVRTLIVPNQAVATYVTQWKYDSHNRLLKMIYPDEEKVTYGYNLGGLVDHVRGYKSYGYDYVNKIGYDKFEQRTYLKYCNGAETFYSYDPQRRRLENLVVNAKAGTIMDNAYSYDAVSNVLSVKNNAPLPQSGKAGGLLGECIDQKERGGDFEMDTIIGKEQKGVILTLVERVTGFTIIRLLEHGKDAKALAREVNKALRYYKKMGLLHSITTDNGSEFAKFKTIERSLKTPVYFAHPYQSWDKPHIEYLNKLLRQFIPKSSTFEDLTDLDLRRFQNLLNNRPRKNLNYKTPNEVIKNIILEKLH